MTRDETFNLIAAAQSHEESTTRMVREFANMIAGKLRAYDVDELTLKKLKNELVDFDSTRKKWKPRKEQS